MGIEEKLETARPPDMENPEHEKALRRALLNSDFFHESAWVRWEKRLGMREKLFFPIAYASFISGILLAILIQITFFSTTFSTPEFSEGASSNNITTKAATAEYVFQDLYKNGQLRLIGENADGTRIYSLTVHNSTVQIYDKSPYTIDLVAAK